MVGKHQSGVISYQNMTTVGGSLTVKQYSVYSISDTVLLSVIYTWLSLACHVLYWTSHAMCFWHRYVGCGTNRQWQKMKRRHVTVFDFIVILWYYVDCHLELDPFRGDAYQSVPFMFSLPECLSGFPATLNSWTAAVPTGRGHILSLFFHSSRLCETVSSLSLCVSTRFDTFGGTTVDCLHHHNMFHLFCGVNLNLPSPFAYAAMGVQSTVVPQTPT